MFGKLFHAIVIAPIEDIAEAITDPLNDDGGTKSPAIVRAVVPGLSTVEALMDDDKPERGD